MNAVTLAQGAGLLALVVLAGAVIAGMTALEALEDRLRRRRGRR